MTKHSQRIHRQQTTSCLSVFDHFMRLALKGLIIKLGEFITILMKSGSNGKAIKKFTRLRQ